MTSYLNTQIVHERLERMETTIQTLREEISNHSTTLQTQTINNRLEQILEMLRMLTDIDEEGSEN